MKIRTGFVSNSSSSSFIICVKEDATGAEIKMLDFMTTFMDKSHGVKREDVGEYKERLQNEIEDLNKDNVYSQKELEELTILLEDPLLIIAFNKLEVALQSMGKNGSDFKELVRRERYMYFCNIEDGEVFEPSNLLRNLHRKLEYSISRNTREIKDLSRRLAKIKDLPKSKKLISFEADNMEDSLLNSINNLEEQNMITIIERKHS